MDVEVQENAGNLYQESTERAADARWKSGTLYMPTLMYVSNKFASSLNSSLARNLSLIARGARALTTLDVLSTTVGLGGTRDR